MWNGHKYFNGYGQFNTGAKRVARTHILSWILHNGPVEEGRWVLHKCDIRNCVNPEHLYVGSRRNNVDDMLSRGRQNRGEVNGRSKLTAEKIKVIRYLYKNSQLRHEDIAQIFGVTPAAIGMIVRRERWTHVSDDLTELT